jgi:hypothetical protein
MPADRGRSAGHDELRPSHRRRWPGRVSTRHRDGGTRRAGAGRGARDRLPRSHPRRIHHALGQCRGEGTGTLRLPAAAVRHGDQALADPCLGKRDAESRPEGDHAQRHLHVDLSAPGDAGGAHRARARGWRGGLAGRRGPGGCSGPNTEGDHRAGRSIPRGPVAPGGRCRRAGIQAAVRGRLHSEARSGATLHRRHAAGW